MSRPLSEKFAPKPSRVLRLTSPLMHGADVTALQVALNRRAKSRDIEPADVDGQYGPDTAHAVRTIGYLLGALDSTLDKGATKGTQRIIRNPNVRTPAQRLRASRRKLPVGSPATTALRWAESKVGVKEHPAGSNGGPEITAWLKAVNCGPAPWCGAFAFAVVKAGGGKLTDRARYVPWIVSDAKSRTGGFDGWSKIDDPLVKPGDLVVYDWNGDGVADHVGVLKHYEPGTATVIEGNTSVGNDSNGGQVMVRQRATNSTILGVARVRWPA